MTTITIPRYEEAGRLAALPAARDQVVSSDVFGAAQGRALAGAGQQITQSTGLLDRAVQQMRNEQIETDVLAAENARFGPENEMLFAPESGFFAQRGEAALRSHQDAIKKYNELVAEHGKNLTGPARAAYDKRAAARSRDLQAQIMRHAQQEGRAWQIEVATAHHATIEMGGGKINPYDDGAIEAQFGRLLASNQRLADKTDQSAEWAQTKTLAEHGRLITSMIRTRMAAHDLPAATRLLERYGDRLSPDVRGMLQSEVTAEAEDRSARIIGGGAADAAKVIGGPEQINAAATALMPILWEMESGNRQFDQNGNTVLGEPTDSGRAVGASQILESTAAGVAKQHGIPYSREKLYKDEGYNKMLGSLYYEDLLKKYDGNVYSAYAEWRVGAGKLGELTKVRPGENITLEDFAAAIAAKGHTQSAEDVKKFARNYRRSKDSGAAATSRAAYDRAIAEAPNRHVRHQIEAAYNLARRRHEIDAREMDEATKAEAWSAIGPVIRNPAALPQDATLASILPRETFNAMTEETRVFFDRLIDGAHADRDRAEGPSAAYTELYAGFTSRDPVVRQNAIADYEAHKADYDGALRDNERKQVAQLFATAKNAPDQLPSQLASRALADPALKAAMTAAGIGADKKADQDARVAFYLMLSHMIASHQRSYGRSPSTQDIAGMAEVLLTEARIDTGSFVSSARAALGGNRRRMFEVYQKQLKDELPRLESEYAGSRVFSVDPGTQAPPEFASALAVEAVRAGRPVPTAEEVNATYRDHLTGLAYRYSFGIAPGAAPVAPATDIVAEPTDVMIELPAQGAP